MSKYLLILLGLCSFNSARAQVVWKSKGPLFEDKYITVELEYAMGESPCEMAATPSQYRYRITKITQRGAYYINWRFDYFNCDHQLTTHLNSLQITRNTKTGLITPPDNQFSALKLVNNFNAVVKSTTLPNITSYQPTSSFSIEPKAIIGKLNVNPGEATVLTLAGGYLAGKTIWKWYEGDCNGQAINANNTSITVKPMHTTVYFLRGEGEHPTPCISFQVNVFNTSMAAAGVNGPSQICEGGSVLLTVKGGSLADGAKWVWYRYGCDGTPIGQGEAIYVSPLKTTTYYVRAEGLDGNTACQAHEMVVTGKSQTPDRIDGIGKADYRESFTLTVHGGELATDAKWIWYTGLPDNKIRVGTGRSFYIPGISSDQTFYVRAEGTCNNSDFAVTTVRLTVHQQPATVLKNVHQTKFFVNAGIVANDPNHLQNLKNYVATIGGGNNIGWFFRAKVSGDETKAAYETTGTQIINYNSTGYYQYNGQIISKRTGYTGGIYLGVKNIAMYLGGGYGTLDLLYEIDQYSYGYSFTSGSAWVKNTTYSYSGAEVEGGIILKAGLFNMMGGVSNITGKYTDYNVGIGFNF